MNSPLPLILIDSSYFSFYRLHATKSWWNRAHPENKLDNNSELITIPGFLDKYSEHFMKHVQGIAKHFGTKLENMWFMRDCPQHTIWRVELYPDYKAHRRDDCEQPNHVGPLIKWSNDNILAKGPMKMIRIEKAEADDIIATFAIQNHMENQGIRHCYIVGNDSDYFQLLRYNNIKLFKMASNFKIELIETDCTGDEYLNIKVISGDKTDNIMSLFPGCGKVTAKDFYLNPNKLQEKLNDSAINQRYQLNFTLVDFRNIPAYIKDEILKHYPSLVIEPEPPIIKKKIILIKKLQPT